MKVSLKKIILSIALITLTINLCAHDIQLTVQPYKGIHCFANGKKIPHTLCSHDNSLGLIPLKLPENTHSIRISAKGFTDKRLAVKDLKQNTAIVLDKATSEYRYAGAISVGRQPKSVSFVNPTTVAVPLLEGKGIDIVNIANGERKRIAPPKKYASKVGFVESLVLAEQNELWVSQMTTACIHVFSLKDFSYKRSIQSSGKWGKVMAYNPVKNCVYFSNWITKDVSIIDTKGYREINRVEIGAVPRGMVCTKNGRTVYVAEFEVNGKARGQVLKIDTQTLKPIARFGKKGAKRHIVMNADETRLYVSDMAHATIEVFSTKDNSLIKGITVGDKPNTIALSPDEKILYVSCRGPNNPIKGYLHKGLEMGKIYVIDTETLSIKESWEGGNQPTGLDISPDGNTLVFSDFLDKRLRIYKKAK